MTEAGRIADQRHLYQDDIHRLFIIIHICPALVSNITLLCVHLMDI